MTENKIKVISTITKTSIKPGLTAEKFEFKPGKEVIKLTEYAYFKYAGKQTHVFFLTRKEITQLAKLYPEVIE